MRNVEEGAAVIERCRFAIFLFMFFDEKVQSTALVLVMNYPASLFG